jgi:CRISPR-associated endonuclease/helicase Cas3
MIYFAHSKGSDTSDWQTIQDHLEGAARLAREIGSATGVSEFAYIAASLHDIGKYSQAFQRRILGSNHSVDHKTAGAKEIIRLISNSDNQQIIANSLAYCIMGHHGGLLDYGSQVDTDSENTLFARIHKKQVEDYSAYSSEIDVSALVLPERIPIRPIKGAPGFSVSFFTRMIYSILVDADFLDTETFVNGGKKPRGEYESIPTLAQRFEEFLRKFENPQGAINQRRTETMKACIGRAREKPGLFTLTLPTGGGKTFTSMGFALRHAFIHDLKRIIYVIPYTSIIEQNAAEFKKSLGENTVLEHHSNFDWNLDRKRKSEEDEESNALAKLKLASENWDIPIIVTTNVQFYKSLFSNKPSKCRKIHNLAKSVILFDEAQLLPREYLKPCLYSVVELVKNYGASAVFCTATQPCIEQFLPEGTKIEELIPDPQSHFDFYKRVNIEKKGTLTDEGLIQELNYYPQVLCIVNTRKHAKGLYAELTGEGNFHLSTLMCPVHRSAVIEKIRERLRQGMTCRVISTQLLEAGVDLDFPVGYRALAGLESIIQAAGRVNREGKKESGTLYVFEPDSQYTKRIPVSIQQAGEVARLILNNYDDPICIEAIREYFGKIYNLHDPGAFDSQKILACFEKEPLLKAFDFQTAAERFKLIENNTASVIIPFDEKAITLLYKLQNTEFPSTVARSLQPYTVNIYEPEYQALVNAGTIDIYQVHYAVLNQRYFPEFYNKETGLTIPENQGGQAIFIDF